MIIEVTAKVWVEAKNYAEAVRQVFAQLEAFDRVRVRSEFGLASEEKDQ